MPLRVGSLYRVVGVFRLDVPLEERRGLVALQHQPLQEAVALHRQGVTPAELNGVIPADGAVGLHRGVKEIGVRQDRGDGEALVVPLEGFSRRGVDQSRSFAVESHHRHTPESVVRLSVS